MSAQNDSVYLTVCSCSSVLLLLLFAASLLFAFKQEASGSFLFFN